MGRFIQRKWGGKAAAALLLAGSLALAAPAFAAGGSPDTSERPAVSGPSGPAAVRLAGSSAVNSPAAKKSGRKKGLVRTGKRTRYYVNGKPLKKCWKTVSGRKYYFKKNGNAAVGSYRVGKTYYIFDAKGRLVKASSKKEVKVNGVRYQVKKGGKAAPGWNATKTYYYAKTGRQVKNGWSSGRKYYFGTDGKRVTGLRYVIRKKTGSMAEYAFAVFGADGKLDAEKTARIRKAAVQGERMDAFYALAGQPKKRKILGTAGCFRIRGEEGGQEGILTYRHFLVYIYVSADGEREYYLGAETR